MSIECLVCHTSKSENSILLRLYDKQSKKRVDTSGAIKTMVGTEKGLMNAIDQNHNQRIDLNEFHDLARIFKAQKLNLEFWGEMTVKTSPEGHRVGIFENMKDCNTCHASDSAFFNHVYLSVTVPDGTVEHLRMDMGVLSSPLVADFFTVHDAKDIPLDRWGWMFVLGIACLTGGHLAVRCLTLPLRRRRRK